MLLQDHPTLTLDDIQYKSPAVQNELLDIMGSIVQRQLLTDIRKAKNYSIMADDTSDVSNKEQMCLVIRYVSIS